MKTDMQTLIAAIRTERDSLTKALMVLEEQFGGATPAQAVARVKKATAKPRKARRTRQHLSDDVKRQIVNGMQQAGGGERQRTAQKLARSFGAKPDTIYMRWHRWQRELNPTPTNGQPHESGGNGIADASTPLEMM